MACRLSHPDPQETATALRGTAGPAGAQVAPADLSNGRGAAREVLPGPGQVSAGSRRRGADIQQVAGDPRDGGPGVGLWRGLGGAERE
ncbi:hypothetical protein [uncultured Thiodictyon sp.]|uniref:hypothetical protein n=1 Tax=uncultured Thiodictyon sp. TaxID=1846217 RepID=UPI0025FB0A9E|nr:hypothetical protein [uncultured Thiodictyon sp.]